LNIQRAARRKLLSLAASVQLADLAALPGNRFERLKDDRKGQCSIRVNDQWRICFLWRNTKEEDPSAGCFGKIEARSCTAISAEVEDDKPGKPVG
jgi:plasmid maintenance system killer protein